METPVIEKSDRKIEVLSDLEALSHHAASIFVTTSKKSIETKKRFVVVIQEDRRQEDCIRFWVPRPIGIRSTGNMSISSGRMNAVCRRMMKQAISRLLLIHSYQESLYRQKHSSN